MSTSDAAEAAWEASDAGKAAWAAICACDARSDAAIVAGDAARAAYYASRAAYLAKALAPVHDREPPANHPEIPEGCPLCVKVAVNAAHEAAEEKSFVSQPVQKAEGK